MKVHCIFRSSKDFLRGCWKTEDCQEVVGRQKIVERLLEDRRLSRGCWKTEDCREVVGRQKIVQRLLEDRRLLRGCWKTEDC